MSRRTVPAIAAALLFATVTAARGADLRLFGALSLAGGGDLNRALRGWEAYYRDRSSEPFSFTSDLGAMEWFLGGGAVVTIPLGTRFSLGLGGEIFKGTTSGLVKGSFQASSSESPVEGERRDITTEETSERTPAYDLTGVSVSVMAFYALPFGRGLRAYIGAGPGLYFGNLAFREEFDERLETQEVWTSGDARTTYLNRYSATGLERQEVRSTNVGILVLAGFDVRLGSSLGLWVEAGARRAVWSAWEGSRFLSTEWSHVWGEDGRLTASGNDESTSDGRLWAVEAANPETGRSYDRLVFSAERPSSTAWQNARPAAIGLTGLSLRVGLTVRL